MVLLVFKVPHASKNCIYLLGPHRKTRVNGQPENRSGEIDVVLTGFRSQYGQILALFSCLIDDDGLLGALADSYGRYIDVV
jgi:hypothetical protein